MDLDYMKKCKFVELGIAVLIFILQCSLESACQRDQQS